MSARRGRRRRSRLSLWPAAATRRRWLRSFRRAPRPLQLTMVLATVALLALIVNGVYQLIRKPTELFLPVSGGLYKTPAETWHDYAPLFRRYSTATIEPGLLAALAQVEGSGNPLVRTYWRWSWTPQPFEMYRPASSAVGMYQITNGTFEVARHYCIHNHALVHEGAWNDFGSCWFDALYLRMLPGDAVELTAAYLDLEVGNLLAQRRLATRPAEVRHVAAVVHLCGAGAAESYVRRGLRFSAGERCGDHDPRAYLARVDAMYGVFATLAAADAALQ
jgi:hypothetical protein